MTHNHDDDLWRLDDLERPYDHFGAQATSKPANIRGYAIDPVAQIDTPEITFQWMDYVLRGGKKLELLKDRINHRA